MSVEATHRREAGSPVDLSSLLAAVEESSPVDAVDALGLQLASTLGASHSRC